MQGMYTLMNGLTMAFALGATYILSWAISGILGEKAQRFSWISLGLGLEVAIVVAALGLEKSRVMKAKLVFGSLMLAMLAWGYILGLGRVSNLDQRGSLGAITLGCIFASLMCFAAYKYFTRMYAETIYRAFNLYEKPNKPAQT